MKTLKIAIMSVAASLAIEAQATLFDITFTSNDGSTQGSGVLNGISDGGGVYTAGAGSFFDIFASISTPFLPGTYQVYPSSSLPPNSQYSPSGFFIYDNAVLNGQNPFITNPGLLFIGPNGFTLELNLFSNGPSSPVPNGTYQLYDNRGVNLYGDATLSPISSVPEVSTILAGLLLVLPLGASTLRILRRTRTA